MRYFLISTLLMISATGFAWDIVKEKDDMFLVDKKMAVKEKVFAIADKTPVEVTSLSKDILMLRYLETKAGTKYFAQTFNCAIYNLATKKMITVDQLCKTITTSVGGKAVEANASFKVTADGVMYSFEELDEKFPLK